MTRRRQAFPYSLAYAWLGPNVSRSIDLPCGSVRFIAPRPAPRCPTLRDVAADAGRVAQGWREGNGGDCAGDGDSTLSTAKALEAGGVAVRNGCVVICERRCHE